MRPFLIPDHATLARVAFPEEITPAWMKAMVLQLAPDEGDDSDAEQQIRMEIERQFSDELNSALRGQMNDLLPPTASDDLVRQAANRVEETSAPVRDVLRRHLLRGADLGVGISFDQMQTIGMAFDWTLAHTQAAQWSSRYSYDLIQGMNQTTRTQLQTAINEWFTNSDSLATLRRQLEPTFGPRRAQLVAQTETTRAAAEGSIAGYEQSGVVNEMEWQTVNDERVCPVCGPLQGQRAPLRGTFPGGYSAPAHPGCRCFVRPVIETPKPQEQEAETNSAMVVGDQEFMPFSETRTQSIDHDAMNRAAEKWGGTLSEDQFVAVRRWTNNWQQTRRNIAEGNIGPKEQDLLDALETAPKIQGIVYRGINPGNSFQSVQDILDGYRRGVGTQIEWDTVSSSSILPDTAAQFGNTVFEVKTQTARYINPLSHFYGKPEDEYEAVFMPNTKFKIVAVSPQKVPVEFIDGPRDRWIIQLEEIAQ